MKDTMPPPPTPITDAKPGKAKRKQPPTSPEAYVEQLMGLVESYVAGEAAKTRQVQGLFAHLGTDELRALLQERSAKTPRAGHASVLGWLAKCLVPGATYVLAPYDLDFILTEPGDDAPAEPRTVPFAELVRQQENGILPGSP